MGAILFLMVDGSQFEIVLADAEAVFDLGQADVDVPEFFCAIALQIGAQQVGPVGQFGPVSPLVVTGDTQCQPLFTATDRVVDFVNGDVVEAGGTTIAL